MTGSQIGQNCNIGQNVFVATNVVIGDNVKIQNNVSIYTGVMIENDVFIGPSVVFTNVINPRSRVERKSEYQPTIVQRGASIGANSTVLCGITLGHFSFIGAGAVVTRSVPDYALVFGNPARVRGWMCECGVKLNLRERMDISICSACGKVYRVANGALIVSPATVAAESETIK